jgi:glycosyltransferase involved in cell wall biosynthesis
MDDLPVIIQARWGYPIGYSISAEEIALHLDALGVVVSHRPTPWPVPGDIRHPRLRTLAARPVPFDAIQLSYETANLFTVGHPGYRVGFTMLEVDGLPDDWVSSCNAMDEVWVPSHWGAAVFAEMGVSRPLFTMPLGYDPTRFHPGLPAHRRSGRYTFLSVFEWGARKGPDVLLRAYAAAFRRTDDVLLVLRVNNHDPDVDVAAEIARLGLGDDGPPVAIVLNTHLAPDAIGQLYCSADCFVLPTRGEGWGLPILEAMACGLPVIATDWSAQTEFMHAGVALPLRVARLVPADGKCPFYEGFRWAEPDFEHLVESLRAMAAQPAAGRALGAAAAAEVRRRWTWQQAAERMAARLRQIG